MVPQAQGKYVLQATGSGGGVKSNAPHVTFCIVTCQPNVLVEKPTDTPTSYPADITISPTVVTITPTGTVTIYPTAKVEFWASPPYANAGQCTTLNWNVSDAKYVYLDGNQVNFSGSQQVCPCQTTTYTLSVYEMDGTQKDSKVTVTVSGSCQGPTTEPPTWAPPTTEPHTQAAPMDTTGLSISGVSLVGEGCQFYGQAYVDD